MKVLIPDNDPFKVRFVTEDGVDVTASMAVHELRIRRNPKGGVIVNIMSEGWEVERDTNYVSLFGTVNGITEVSDADFHSLAGTANSTVHVDEPKPGAAKKRSDRVPTRGGGGAQVKGKKRDSAPRRKAGRSKTVDL